MPGALAGSRLVARVDAERLRSVFGVLLISFAAYFVGRQVVAA
jgi:uncharacterized membrane protein YfcA